MSTAPIPNVALASFSKAGSFYQSALLSSGDAVSRMGTVAMGQPVLQRGQIVNIDPVSSAIIPAVLGTSVPNAIVAENCDATLALQKCLVYVSAKVKYDQLIWPATGSHTAIIDALRDSDILVEGVMLPSGEMTSNITPVTLTPATDTELAAGGNGNFAVAMTGAGSWFYTQDGSSAWVHVTSPTAPQTANGSVQYHIDVNGFGEPARVGKIFVNGQTYTINQGAG